MNRTRKIASAALMACCLALAVFAGVSAMLDSLQQGETWNVSLSPAVKPPPAAATPNGGIELNTATREQLMGLTGIGEHLAEAIIAQREINPFYFVEDLKAVSGIGDRRVEALRGLVYIKTATPIPSEDGHLIEATPAPVTF